MSLRLTPQSQRKFSGNSGEDDLKQSLTLLFLIKGQLYQKKSPDFLIPSAEEFFTFCKFVNQDIFQKSQIKKIHRSLSAEKFEDHTQYLEFFEYILQTTTLNSSDHVCLCINIVFYAVFLYVCTGIIMKLSLDTSKTIGSLNYNSTYSLFVPPIQWFCIHTMPCLEKHRKDILSLYHGVYYKHISTIFKTNDPAFQKSISKIAQTFSETFDTVLVEPGSLDTMLKKPVLSLLGLYA